jgi:Concanavalin A-like lectin/glucanases superfamily
VAKNRAFPLGRTTASSGIWWSALDNRFRFGFGDLFGTGIIATTNTFPPGKYYHVSATYDGSAFRLYVNGRLEAQQILTKQIDYDSSVPWTIGSASPEFRSVGFPRTFNGVIDEVTIYGRALSEEEVQARFTHTTEVTVRVEDGRGGEDLQTFVLGLQPGEIRGSVLQEVTNEQLQIIHDAQGSSIVFVNDASALVATGFVDWGELGGDFTKIANPFAFGIQGIPGLNVTVAKSNDSAPFERRNQTTGWSGNFFPNSKLLWTGSSGS